MSVLKPRGNTLREITGSMSLTIINHFLKFNYSLYVLITLCMPTFSTDLFNV